MSLITRCPSCGTMFKVVPDQLRISEGWVRCGHCAKVFDARHDLQPWHPPVPPPVAPPQVAEKELAPESAAPSLDALSGMFDEASPANAPELSPSTDSFTTSLAPRTEVLDAPDALQVPEAPEFLEVLGQELAPEPEHAAQSLDAIGGAFEEVPLSDVPATQPLADSLTISIASRADVQEAPDALEVPEVPQFLAAQDVPEILEASGVPEVSAPPVIQDVPVALEVPSQASPVVQAPGAPPAPDEVVSSGPLLVNLESELSPRLDAEFVPAGVSQTDASPPIPVEVPWPVVSGEPDSVLDEDVSFVREARRKAFWRRPLIRTALTLVSLLLACVLVLQVAMHDRDRLVAWEPELQPWVAGLCVYLDCTVGVPRQIESVVIDSSTFDKGRGDVYRLSFTLRNTSGLALSTPAVELTLTDTQDRAVVRRVLRPAEFGAGLSLPPKGDWNAVLHMNVDANGGAGRVAGYRLLAFYP